MNIDLIELRKCVIKDFKTKLVCFLAEDLSDCSEKEIFLRNAKQITYDF